MSHTWGDFDFDFGFYTRVLEQQQIIAMESPERQEVRRDVEAMIRVPGEIWMELSTTDFEQTITTALMVREDRGEEAYRVHLKGIHDWGVAILRRHATERDSGDIIRDIGKGILEEFVPLPPVVGIVVDILADATREAQGEIVDMQNERDNGRALPAVERPRPRRTERLARRRAARMAGAPSERVNESTDLWYSSGGLRRRRGSSESFAPEMEAEPIDVPTVTQPGEEFQMPTVHTVSDIQELFPGWIPPGF